MKTRELRKCVLCDKDFFISKSQSLLRVGKYCSWGCMHLGRRNRVQKKCKSCDSAFVVKRNVSLKKNMGKYCSIACYRKDKVFTMSKLCLFCKDLYSIKKRAHVKSKFCSKTCKDKYWTRGSTPQDKLLRSRFTQTIQKQVFLRDGYTCQMCKVKGGNLQVDHIQPWAEYVELRFDINNCRTLCQKCHYKITFGREMPKKIKTWGHNLSKC